MNIKRLFEEMNPIHLLAYLIQFVLDNNNDDGNNGCMKKL